MKYILTATLLCLIQVLYSQELKVSTSEQLAESITSSDLRTHVSTLASDEYEGREAGTRGNDKAAAYIAKVFSDLGVKPANEKSGYFQAIEFTQYARGQSTLTVNDSTFLLTRDYYRLPELAPDTSIGVLEEVVFLGYGIKDVRYNDYKRVKGGSLRGKAILILQGEPRDADGNFRISSDDEPSEWSSSLDKKLTLARQYGVRLVMIYSDKANEEFKPPSISGLTMRSGDHTESNLTMHLYINNSVYTSLINSKLKKINKRKGKIIKKGKSKPLAIKNSVHYTHMNSYKRFSSNNVLGIIEGADPDLADQYVAITAHYDHLGKRGDKVYNGADDNASGTSAILEIAQAMMEARKNGEGPRRSVVFGLMTAEEKGLLGSRYYTDNPLYPLDQTVVNINVDMIGRIAKAYEGNPNYIYVIGADRISSELHDINEQMNAEHTQLTLDYTYNEEDDPNRYYYRSDHYNFAKHGVPAIFYFNGTHADYHKASDTIEKINFEKMERINRLIFHTAWNIANRDHPLIKDILNQDK